MPKQNQNDSPKEQKQADTKKDPGKNLPQARGGGQTDSATGAKPGGGGQPQGGKK